MNTYWTFEDINGVELNYEFDTPAEAINEAQDYLFTQGFKDPERVQFIENDECECIRVVRRTVEPTRFEKQPAAFCHKDYGLKG